MELLSNITDAINLQKFQEKLCGLIKNDNANIKIDNSGNIIAYIKGKDSSAKTMISIVCERTATIITSTKDKTAEFEEFSLIDKAALSDKEVFIDSNSVGVIRSEYKEDKIVKQKIELWEENTLQIGDFVNINNECFCKGDNLYGFGVNRASQIYPLLYILNKTYKPVNDIYFTISFSEKAAKALTKTINPDYIFHIYSADTSDDFKTSNGCGIVYKDGNMVTDFKLRDFMINLAKSNGIAFQKYIGKSAKILEDFSIIGGGALASGICLPVKYINSGCPVMSKPDIINAANLIFNIVNYRESEGENNAK